MKKKELKNLAQKIAKQEIIVQTSGDKEQVRRAEKEIMRLCGCVDSVSDMVAIDDLVAELLAENLEKN